MYCNSACANTLLGIFELDLWDVSFSSVCTLPVILQFQGQIHLINEMRCLLFQLKNHYLLHGNDLFLNYVTIYPQWAGFCVQGMNFCLCTLEENYMVCSVGWRDDRNIQWTQISPPLIQLELLLRLHSGLFPRHRNIICLQLVFKKIYTYLTIFTQCLWEKMKTNFKRI